MVLWIGVDDTDSLQGMCTTFLATELVRDLTQDHDLIGYPRLVRLNPNIPWKTRGNGAVCVRVGSGRGVPRLVGFLGGRHVLAYPRGAGSEDPVPVAGRVANLLERWASFDDETTNPGYAVLRGAAPPRLYWKGVRAILSRGEVCRAVAGLGIIRGYKSGRGIIGAIAATAWKPRDRTYEVLAYRVPSRWGTRRFVDHHSVITMDRALPSTFNNYDYENRRVAIAPRSPCPILYGIRGDDPEALLSARSLVRSECADRWLLFETNQGTDDHVRREAGREPWTTIHLRGSVSVAPRDLPGGHVVFRVRDLDVTAYEPSKQFRGVVRQLVRGDRVDVVGAIRRSPRTVNLEKLKVVSLASVTRKIANPWCPKCRKRAKSLGRDAGFRCRGCGCLFPMSTATHILIPRSLRTGWYEPPVGSRRHLSKPLKRFRIPSADRSA
jgi:tRNA(Ile2)-agmatinylcytidine synthase